MRRDGLRRVYAAGIKKRQRIFLKKFKMYANNSHFNYIYEIDCLSRKVAFFLFYSLFHSQERLERTSRKHQTQARRK